MEKNETKVFSITFVLLISWIAIYGIKSHLNKNGVQNYTFIQRNTIGFWLLIFISLSLSQVFFKNYVTSILIFFGLFIVHELLWYFCYIQFTKDESEVTFNFYRWGNIYCDNIKDIDNLSGTDLTEGMYDNNWNLTNSKALNLKYNTYFNYLKLKSGMKLLDIGCGNCLWLNFCKKRGVVCTGLTITQSQADFCKSKGITDIIVGDIQKNVLLTIHEKFDAITNIGAMEHFSSVSQPPNERIKTIKRYYNQVKHLINEKSDSGRYLNSYLTINENYSKRNKLSTLLYFYLLASCFGYGAYLSDSQISQIYNSSNSKIVIKRDCTEDYRWMFVKNKNTMATCNYKLDSLYRYGNYISDLITDPASYPRMFYGPTKCWSWQFGGTHRYPDPTYTDTPIRCYIYVTKIN